MKKKIVCFGVRDYEVPYFNELGKKYDYDLVLKKEYLNDSCVDLAKGFEVVMVRGNCAISKENYKYLKDNGLKYYLTRTAGFNHVDIEACKENNIEAAFVPGYSPSAISELALSLTMSLLRNTSYSSDKSAHLDFKVTDQMFSKEIRSCTVGIIGCGRIGLTTANIFKGIGAKVLGYDKFPKDTDLVKYVSLEELLKESDVIIIHAAYFKGQNDNLISDKEIKLMKKGVVLVNVARGELLDTDAALKGIKEGIISGLGLDVIKNEKDIFNHSFNDIKEIKDKTLQELISLYPKVLITPHVASATVDALIDMIEISLQNMDEYLTTNKCKNSLIK